MAEVTHKKCYYPPFEFSGGVPCWGHLSEAVGEPLEVLVDVQAPAPVIFKQWWDRFFSASTVSHSTLFIITKPFSL